MTAFEGIEIILILIDIGNYNFTGNINTLCFLEFGILPEIGKAVEEEGWT